MFQVNATPQLHDPLINVLTKLSHDLSVTLQSATEAIQFLQHSIHVQYEELNFLWWLQTQFSRDLGGQFREVGYVAGTVIFAMELADLTKIVPGPDAVLGVLSQALQAAGAPSSAAQLTLAEAINATPRSWREGVASRHKLRDLGEICPVLLALHKSLETDEPDAWLPVYRKVCGSLAERPIPILTTSFQIYRERLLLHACFES